MNWSPPKPVTRGLRGLQPGNESTDLVTSLKGSEPLRRLRARISEGVSKRGCAGEARAAGRLGLPVPPSGHAGKRHSHSPSHGRTLRKVASFHSLVLLLWALPRLPLNPSVMGEQPQQGSSSRIQAGCTVHPASCGKVCTTSSQKRSQPLAFCFLQALL